MYSTYQQQFGGGTAPSFGGAFDWGFGAGSFSVSNLVQEVGEHEKAASSVREYAYTEDKNYKFRPGMEDTYCIRDKLGGDPNCGLFAVFDGHGGKQVADHCKERVPDEMKKEVPKTPGDLSYIIETIFLKVILDFELNNQQIDNECRLLDADQTGSTACVSLVRKEFGHNVLYVANVGDTRAVLSKNGVAERLSYDHKATNQQEVDRIKSGGGIVLENRVGGSLAITRAFGDHALKRDGVTAKPFINKHVLRPFDKYLVIASDGVWDVLEDQDAINFCKEEYSTKDIAQAIVKSSLDKGSKDNISCIVIKFNSTSPF